MALHRLVFDTTDSGTRGDSAQVGAVLYDAVNDRLGVINASQELQVRDDDANTSLASILSDSSSIDSTLTGLSKAEDAAHVSGDQGIMGLAVRNDVEGSLVDADGDYAPLQVDSSGRLRVVADLDSTNLSEKIEDDAHSSGDIGDYVLAVRADSRPTNANTSADGDYASFFVNNSGELYVKDTDAAALLTTIDADTSSIATDASTLAALSKAEDAAHSSGDTGIMGLAVRSDTLASLADTDGDYTPLQVDANGALYIVPSEEIDVNDTANTAILAVAETVGVTAAQIVDGADELANRKYLYLYHNGNRDIYVGQSGITVGTGFPIPPQSILEMRLGDAVDLYAISDGASQDLRTLQVS